MFVRTEHHVAYATMFKAVRNYASIFFSIDLVLSFGSLDRSQCIASAFREVLPNIRLLNCYPHLARNRGASDKVGLLTKKSFYDDDVAVNIRYLSVARSEEQFKALPRLFVDYWRSEGEVGYANWFEDTYLGSTWMFWYYRSAIPCVTPSKMHLNPTTALLRKRAWHPFAPLFQQSLYHLSEGPLCSESVENTQRLLDNKKNYYKLKVPVTRVLFGVLFNATKFLKSSKNVNGSDLDRRRAQRVVHIHGEVFILLIYLFRYLNSLEGKLPEDVTVRNAERYCLSIHQVKLLHVEPVTDFIPSARISIELRRKYVCDCVMFAQTGWQCSHVFAAMVLQEEVSLKRLLSALPTRKASGGQRKAKSCLAKDKADHQFSVNTLIKQHLEKPMSPIHWQVMRDFEVTTKANTTKLESFCGTVESWGDDDGVYYWTVEFPKLKQKLRLECQELAECTHEAYVPGNIKA
ncbi:hypothetical protein F444_03021 [Phytophthora nicotianae P1976]|uniref:SWIM-type domain-containing protein n=1 Tax=Phytophthora nicotianae P1976 TaxID=1317066 RepID=A0A081AVI7_PHYNI|nr:hypothetical protein F444_03021 [Phytophthora nicotianae P1976]